MAIDETPNLELPYIMAAQAQKHVTHNEAIRMLDAVVQLSVKDRDLTAPPASPVDGDRYIAGASATGDWSGKDGQIAAYQDNVWMFYEPLEGWLTWVADEAKLLAWDGSVWNAVASDLAESSMPRVGVNTTASDPNKLAVKSDAVLFGHDDVTPGTGDIRVNLNKSSATDTASFLFQDNWSGRAEIGLIGDDDFHFKTSSDGSNWKDALRLQASSGDVYFDERHVCVTGGWLKVDDGAEGYFHIRNDGSLDMSRASGSAIYVRGRSAGSTVSFGATDSSSALKYPLVVDANNNNIRPQLDNVYDIGSASYRYSTIYAATGTINTSDAREKTSIMGCDLGLDFVNSLRPVSYKWKIGGYEQTGTREIADGEDILGEPIYKPRPGRRTHYGFLAQDIKAALDARGVKDFGGWVLDDNNAPDSRQGLRYDQFIALLVKSVQELSAQIEDLQGKYKKA